MAGIREGGGWAAVPSRGTPRSAALRYLLIAIFPVGVICTWPRWANYAGDALAVSMLGSLCFALFLNRVRTISAQTLMPSAVAAVLIVGHPLKAYFLAAVPWTPEALGALGSVETYGDLSVALIYNSYEMAMLSLCVFFLSCVVLMRLLPGTVERVVWVKAVDRRRLAGLLAIAVIVIVVVMGGLDVLSLSLGIGRSGVEPVRLPFRLGGFIVFFQQWLGNGLLVVLYLAWQAKLKRTAAIAMSGLVVASIGAAVVTASRGAVLWWVLEVLCLTIVMGTFRWRWLLNVKSAAVLAIVIAAYPVVTQYRYLTTQAGLGDLAAASEALQGSGELLVRSPGTLLDSTVGAVFARVLGLDELIIVQQRMVRPLPREAWHYIVQRGQPIGMYYTREVLGIDTFSWRAIGGTLGTFWLFGGKWLVVLGMFPYVVGLFVVRALWTHGLPVKVGDVSLSMKVAGPVLAAIWVVSAMTLTMEGDVIGGTGFLHGEKLLLMFIGLFMTEMAARWMVGRCLVREKGQ